MANAEESSPFLPPSADAPAKKQPVAAASAAAHLDREWMAEGVPVAVGAGTERMRWDSGLLSCLGRNDEFCSSDFEVCLLGSFAPCVLYGSNVERLVGAPGSFANSCLPYAGLYALGNFLLGWNCLSPWLSYPTRTAIRRRYNLEGSLEAFARSCGCCGDLLIDDERREHLESNCDLVTHYFCHPCALCQEGRELRRRQPHPGFYARPSFMMMAPEEQTMGRGM